jgi:anti-anti-sigma factor
MKVRFWGVRGSLPAPLTSVEFEDKLITALMGAQSVDLSSKLAVKEYVAGLPPLVRGTVGGNTPCVSIQVGEELIILDAGSGLRLLGEELMKGEFGRGQGVAHILITHTHWDHIQGFPFFRPAFTSGNRLMLYSPIANLEERLRGQQVPEYFPKPLDYMRADIHFVHLQEGVPITVAGVQVNSILQAHPGRSYSYRLEGDGATIVYATDAEYKNLGDAHTRRYVEFMAGADLLIFDAQYTLSDSFQRIDWGHSSSVIGVDMATRANVKRLVLFHFEPAYTDKQIQEILDTTLKYIASDPAHPRCEVYLATEGLEFELGTSRKIQLEHRQVGDAVVLSIHGRFDASAAGQVDERLTALISDEPKIGLVVDLSQVTHLSVAGLKTLLNAQQMGQGTPLILAAAPENVREVLSQVGFAEAFVQYDSVKRALAALEAREYLELEGQLLYRRYRVESSLDMGHKAALFKAFDTWFERFVTIKVLSKSLGDESAQLLLREARAVAHMNHPNIASVYDCVEYRDRLYLIREFVEGLTLRHWLDQLEAGATFPPQKVLDTAKGISRGLAYAHGHGVLHRNLRPLNVILSEQGPKIINFGLKDDRREGWLRYMAPEQVAEEDATARSDLYSLGAILYELATGQSPFAGNTSEELVQERMRSDPVSPRHLNPSVPLSLERIISNLLDRNPMNRYPSATAVHDALEEVKPWEN